VKSAAPFPFLRLRASYVVVCACGRRQKWECFGAATVPAVGANHFCNACLANTARVA